MLAPAKLKVQKQLNLGKLRPSFSFNSGANNTASNSSTVLSSNTLNTTSTFTGNDKVTNSLFTFGDKKRSDNGSTASVPLTTFQSIPVDAKRDLFKELGRLMFGENSSEFSKLFVPNEPVKKSENVFTGLSLRDEERVTTVKESSAKNKTGHTFSNVKPMSVKPSFRSGLSGVSSGSTSKFYWHDEPTTSFPTTVQRSESSRDSKENIFNRCSISTNPGGSEATASSGSWDTKATSSHEAKKPNFNHPAFPRTFTDPTLQNLNEFFSNIPKSSILSGSAVTSTVDPPLENRTSNDSSKDIFEGLENTAEKE